MIRLGTRASVLALAQAGVVADALRRAGQRVELRPMRTKGDRLFGARLADAGGKGLFVREIEEALVAGDVDIAVHSLKDLPAELPDGVVLAAFPEREDPRDVLVTSRGHGLDGLPPGAVVGTSSLRRRALLLAARADLVVEPLRGNVDTRLRRLEAGVCDAVIVAAAGLRRLGLQPPHAVWLAPEVFVPAVGQGILAIEVRGDDAPTRRAVAGLDHRATRVAAVAERAYLRRLGASCNTPMGAHAIVDGARVTMVAMVASEDGRRVLRAEGAAPVDDAERLGRGLAESLLARGAADVAALDPRRWAS